MVGEKLSSKTQNSDASKWENLAPEPNNAEHFAKQLAENIYDLQKSFAKQLERSAARGEKQIPQKEFEIWENEYRYNWRALENQLQRGNLVTMAQEAEVEESMIAYTDDSELHKTIEAQAGRYYDERSDALLKAIRESDSPTRQEDLEYVRSFRRAVMQHLDYKYIEGSGDWRREDSEYYNHSRTKAHNEVIEHLNGLNALSEKYGTRRFTPRDFWTSKNQHQTPAMSRRMRYDRDIVEEYYAIAFAYEIKDYEKEQAQNRRYY